MIVTTILNGNIKIILTPETELEKAVLNKFSQVSVEKSTDNLIVMNKPMPDSLIFSNQPASAISLTPPTNTQPSITIKTETK